VRFPQANILWLLVLPHTFQNEVSMKLKVKYLIFDSWMNRRVEFDIDSILASWVFHISEKSAGEVEVFHPFLISAFNNVWT